MTELVILSGKGGTGKTTVAASLVALAQRQGHRPVAVDCDVDAANLFLVLNPVVTHQTDFSGGSLAIVDPGRCTLCGVCVEKCLFGAMTGPGQVDAYACEGCGVCAIVCPEAAVTLRAQVTGAIQTGTSDWGAVVWAHLRPGAGNSGKLVAAVRDLGKRSAAACGSGLVIADGPPGIGCPVISSLTGASMALLVTEPSVSGYHDLVRIAELCSHFDVPAAVVINKADLATETTLEIRRWCDGEGLRVLAEIPFDAEVPVSIANAKPLVTGCKDDPKTPAAIAVAGLWERLLPLLPSKP